MHARILTGILSIAGREALNWLRTFDFDDLLILCQLGKGESISATGRTLGLTQSAITHRLRKIETTFLVKICERRGSRSELTAEGKIFAGYATDAIGLIEASFGSLLPRSAPKSL